MAAQKGLASIPGAGATDAAETREVASDGLFADLKFLGKSARCDELMVPRHDSDSRDNSGRATADRWSRLRLWVSRSTALPYEGFMPANADPPILLGSALHVATRTVRRIVAVEARAGAERAYRLGVLVEPRLAGVVLAVERGLVMALVAEVDRRRRGTSRRPRDSSCRSCRAPS